MWDIYLYGPPWYRAPPGAPGPGPKSVKCPKCRKTPYLQKGPHFPLFQHIKWGCNPPTPGGAERGWPHSKTDMHGAFKSRSIMSGGFPRPLTAVVHSQKPRGTVASSLGSPVWDLWPRPPNAWCPFEEGDGDPDSFPPSTAQLVPQGRGPAGRVDHCTTVPPRRPPLSYHVNT